MHGTRNIAVIAMVDAVLALLVGCSADCPPPPKPDQVPTSAVWAGGCDGGTWVECQVVSDDSSRHRCAMFDDFKGAMVASGEFVRRPGTDTLRRSTTDVLTYNFYNGTVIGMTNGDTLVPNGWIEYPDAGKRQLFKDGEPESEELVVEPAS